MRSVQNARAKEKALTDVSVAAEERLEGARLVPAHEQLRVRVAEEAANIRCVRVTTTLSKRKQAST